MTPIDFVVFDGDSEPNQPVLRVAEAMRKPIKILSTDRVWEVVSYYLHKGSMVLEIHEAEGSRQ